VTVSRVRLVVVSVFTAMASVMAGGAARAGVVDQPVRTTAANELAGAADGDWIGWSEAPADAGGHYVAMAAESGGDPITLSVPGRQAFVTGIEGTTAVFQQTDPSGSSNIYRYDLVHGSRTKFGPAVNTPGFEYHATLSQGRLLFGRLDLHTHRETVRVFTLSSATTRVVDGVENDETHFLVPGQIAGKFATWAKCLPKCNTYLWNRATDSITKLPNPSGKNQWWPAVTPSGDVFYVREGVHCDSAARVVEDPLNGPPAVISPYSEGDTGTHLSADVHGDTTDVYYSANDCGPPITYDLRRLRITP
jgi:hypothetical protein